MKTNTFHIVSLGCAKNTVDSDSMSQLLRRDGYIEVDTPGQASVVIVNTCGFIQEARDQAYEELHKLAKRKKYNQLLIAAGCLTQRYGEEVANRVPGVDGILGTRRWMDIALLTKKLRNGKTPEPSYQIPEIIVDNEVSYHPEPNEPQGIARTSIFGKSAYLKIADGCRRPCAFCAIPLIKGPTVSRPLEDIVREAQKLEELGIREVNLLAQDTTDYGCDLGMKEGLSHLLESITDAAPNIDWIRILYAYPGYVTDRLVEVMSSRPQILPYLDIPLQHADPKVLIGMHRPANMEWVYATIARMRKILPGLAIRTTFIVGYPGETEKEFQILLDFIKEIRFDRVGVFKYSFERGTPSEPLGDPISPLIKEERYQRLMTLQQGISLQINQSYVGKRMSVLVEGKDENTGILVGRSYRDAPENDGLVFSEGRGNIGDIISVKITGAMAYDLSGTVVQ